MDFTSFLNQFSIMDNSFDENDSHLGGSARSERTGTNSGIKDEDNDLFPFASEEWHETRTETIAPPLPKPRKSPQIFAKKKNVPKPNTNRVPHQGSLYRIESSPTSESPLSYRYAIEIALENGDSHELLYEPHHFEFMSRLFAILDTESRGLVGRTALMEFVTLRCPVFWRRDEDLRKLQPSFGNDGTSPTFDEVWAAVAQCSSTPVEGYSTAELGVEGWMIFCRFIALAQYLEAKRQFSARHLQQTMKHRNAPRGSELVVVDVPPPESPAPLSPAQLARYERKGKAALPLPELDLDHSLVAAHDAFRRRRVPYGYSGTVKISLFGSPDSVSLSNSALEFTVTYSPTASIQDGLAVRRSFDDLKWLNDTFASHKILGGTLCGRILPPFPGSSASALSTQYQNDDSALKSAIDSTGGAMAAAAAGVNKITGAAKSVLGRYVSTKKPSSSSGSKRDSKKGKNKKVVSCLSLPENYYNPNSPMWKARQLERYLNYLLEHPALSTSFPLNTVLKASQSGLEAAKQSLEDHAKNEKKIKSSLPQLVDGKLSIPFWSHQSGSAMQPNLSWVRTAAQAAMALQVHGILETTGLPSASARLQHASLPSFNNASRGAAWAEEGNDRQDRAIDRVVASVASDGDNPDNFEYGVIHVDSELGGADSGEEGEFEPADHDGYDLLPLPVPAPERRILCAGSTNTERNQVAVDPSDPFAGLGIEEPQARFHYGSSNEMERFDSTESTQVQSAFLGEFSVDDNIDKLREVIGSVENTLTRCLSASAGIGGARRERLELHLEVVKGFDSWEGMRGQFIAQRALLRGVEGLDQSKNVSEESDLDIIDDVSWQTALAGSAVSAAEDVRSTVRAARTAANAKAAADSAAFAAQNACDAGNFSNIDEARAAQTRSSIAQSHAIHAAVVEHEANTAKRRAALALAHDVKCWNVHRKRELLRTCLSYARSQHVASRRAVDAWSCLRDGFVGSSTVPFTETRSRVRPKSPEEPEATAVIFQENVVSSSSMDDPASPIVQTEAKITAVDHDLLASDIFNEFGLDKADLAVDESSEHDPVVPLVEAAPVTPADVLDEAFAMPDEAPKDVSHDTTEGEDPLSASMQSLVDGLMSWGGQYAAEEDLTLPAGMATSIVMEETSNALNKTD